MKHSQPDPEITEAEIAAMAASEAKPKAPIMDAETLRAYSDYLKDWRWNMSTHVNLQRQYMGRSYYPRNENLF